MSSKRPYLSSEYKCSDLSPAARRLRHHLLRLIRMQGFGLGDNYKLKLTTRSKTKIRALHSHFRQDRLNDEQKFVRHWFPKIAHYFASGSEVDPSRIDPYPVVVEDSEELAALFRIACLWWSVPVSKGYGRRFRILVFDRSNGKLFGLLALADPVFNLRTRDSWIGWDVRKRERMLAHVMDAYVLGAVPPYNQLLGAKFIGLLAASDFIKKVFARRYKKTRSVILGRKFDGRLALVTTTSALGTSSVLNRLKLNGIEVFQPLGFTQGYGHFHLANGTFDKIRNYLKSCRDLEAKRYRFGSGPNYRIRVVRKTLERLRLPSDLLRHGVRRGVYVAPLARNTPAFLNGQSSRLRWHRRPLSDVVQYWRERWLLPRASRDSSYLDFHASQWRTILGLDR